MSSPISKLSSFNFQPLSWPLDNTTKEEESYFDSMKNDIQNERESFKKAVIENGLISIVQHLSLLPPVLRCRPMDFFSKTEVEQLLDGLLSSVKENTDRVQLGEFVLSYYVYQPVFITVSQECELFPLRELLEACYEFSFGRDHSADRIEFNRRLEIKHQGLERPHFITEPMRHYAIGSLFWEHLQSYSPEACKKIKDSSKEISDRYIDFMESKTS